jgi:Type II secretory pathway, component PulD
MRLITLKSLLLIAAMLLLHGCADIAPKPFQQSSGHIQKAEPVTEVIPEPAKNPPDLPAPAPAAEPEKYTVVVSEVPVKELLFALARDAKINMDIDPGVEGVATLNAVEQPLPRILDRLARQLNLRYEFSGGHLVIQPDTPFFRTYHIDYLNITRDTSSAITIATQISTTGGGFEGGAGGNAASAGSNNSTTDVKTVSVNHFWETLVSTVTALLRGSSGSLPAVGGEVSATDRVIAIPEAGILTIKATTRQHELIREYLDAVLASANRQVLIQATIIEVDLNDQYKAGIDWSFLNKSAGLSLVSGTLVGAALPAALSLFQLVYNDPGLADEDALKISVNLLDEFGNARVLSSPQVMVMNNQTAVLKVVDNEVFFTIETETTQNQTNTLSTIETAVHTVPVGIVMPITPRINANDSIILNVRPTISRVVDRVPDPNPSLRFAPDGTPLANPIISEIPEIRVREMESVLRMNHGQIAVLGGLMQNSEENNDSTVPGVSRIPIIGNAFKSGSRVYAKTELVIFLRHIIVHNPDIGTDLGLFRDFLDQTTHDQGPDETVMEDDHGK